MQSAGSSYALGIDIGGTFTDLVLYDEARGAYCSHKELTTPDDPTDGVIAGLRHLFERERLPFAAVKRVVHATTLFTNALIERKGAATGLITTEGFRDVLEIARENKYELYDIFIELPQPLVRRSLRLEVPERMSPQGLIEVPLDCEALVRQAAGADRRMASSRSRSSSCTPTPMPAQERLARDVLEQRFPHIFVSISSDVAPQIREYERTSTTVANAYIKPLATSYVGALGARLKALGIGADLFLMLSNGGLTNANEASATRSRCWNPARRRARWSVPTSACAATAGMCWRSTWAAPPPSCPWSRTGSLWWSTASRPGASGASSRARACRSASPPSS